MMAHVIMVSTPGWTSSCIGSHSTTSPSISTMPELTTRRNATATAFSRAEFLTWPPCGGIGSVGGNVGGPAGLVGRVGRQGWWWLEVVGGVVGCRDEKAGVSGHPPTFLHPQQKVKHGEGHTAALACVRGGA